MAKAARYVFLLVLGFFAGVFFLQAQPADTLVIPETDYRLDSAIFRARRPVVEILPSPGVSATVPLSVLKKIPSVMGLADPLRFVFLMPSVQTGDRVDIRFCTMNREIYRFWETFQQLTGISYIMTYPTNFSNLPSNMTGAYGYWAGYGTATYSVNIPEEEEES